MAQKVRPLVGVHLGDQAGGGVHAHAVGEGGLSIFVQPLEDLRRVVRGQLREQLRGLVVVELADDVGDVLGMDLVQQLADFRLGFPAAASRARDRSAVPDALAPD